MFNNKRARNLKYAYLIIIMVLSPLFNQVSDSKESLLPIKTFYATFQREEFEKERYSNTAGYIYFYNSDCIWMRVVKPFTQQIKIDTTGMLIFYPDKKLAIKINTRNSITLSFLTPFLASLRNDYCLPDLGYQMKDYYLKADTLSTEWHPSKERKSDLGTTIIKSISNKVVQVVVSLPDHQPSQILRFYTHTLINDTFWFPESLSIVSGTPQDRRIEKIKLDHISIDRALPDTITSFILPDDTVIKEYSW